MRFDAPVYVNVKVKAGFEVFLHVEAQSGQSPGRAEPLLKVLDCLCLLECFSAQVFVCGLQRFTCTDPRVLE